MIKINLVREGRAVRGAGAAPAAGPSVSAAGGNVNNVLVIGGVVVGALLAGGYWFWMNSQLEAKKEAVAQRQADAKKLEQIIKEVDQYQKRKESLQQRINLINDLKKNQRGPVRIMDQISRDLPDLVWLDRMTINAGKVTLIGRGLNPNAIANFVENIKVDPYFEEPSVTNVTLVGGGGGGAAATPVYNFTMSFSFTYEPKPPKGTLPATTTDTAATGTTATTNP